MRSAPLAEYRAETRELAARLAAHEHADTKMPNCRCAEAEAMRAELKHRREQERTWFAPPPDAESLF